MEQQEMFSKQFHFQQRPSLEPTRMNKSSLLKQFHVPLRGNEAKVSRADQRYEEHKNENGQQAETQSPFSPFQAELNRHSLRSSQNLHSGNGSHLAASERKVIYHKLVPQTARTYQNLDRNLKSKAKIVSHGYTHSQSYLSPSRDIYNSQKVEPTQSRNLLKSKSYQVYEQMGSKKRESLKKRQTSPYNKQIEKKLNHKDSSKSFKSDRLHHKKVEEQQNVIENKDHLKYTKSVKYQKQINPIDRVEYCTFTNLEMTEAQKKNEELEVKIKSLQKEVLSFRVSLKEWCGAENAYQDQIAVLKQTIKQAKLQNLKLNQKMAVKNNLEVYENSVLERVSQENMILIRQIKEGKDMQIREIKELKQRQKEDQRKYQTIIENLERQAAMFKVNELVEIKKQLDRYLAVNKQLQRLLEEEKQKNIDLKCKYEETGSIKGQSEQQFQSMTKQLQITKKQQMESQKTVLQLAHENQQKEMKVKELSEKLIELTNMNSQLRIESQRGENILKEQLLAIQRIHKEKVKYLEQQNSMLQADLVKQQEALQNSRKKVSSVQFDADKSNENMAIQKQLQLTLSKKEEQLIAEKNVRIETSSSLQTLQKCYSQLEHKLQSFQLKQTDMENKMKALTQANVSLQRNNAIVNEENARMKKQMHLVQQMNIQQEIKLTNAHIQKMNMEIDDLRKHNQSMADQHHQEIQLLSKSKDCVIAELEKAVHQQQQQINHLEQANANAQMQLEQNQSALLSDLRMHYTNLNRQIQQNLQHISQLKSRLAQINASVMPMLTKLQIQCKRYEDMEKKFEENTKDVCEVISYLQEQNEELFKELKNSNAKIGDKFRDLGFRNVNGRADKIKNDGDSMAKSLMKENDSLLQMIAKVQAQKIDLVSRSNESLEVIRHLQTRLQELEFKNSSELISMKMAELNRKYGGV